MTRRKLLQQGLELVKSTFHGLGREMNHTYVSAAVVNDEPEQFVHFDKDPVLHYQISTYPGRRLPHVWLRRRIPNEPLISTIDLAGGG